MTIAIILFTITLIGLMYMARTRYNANKRDEILYNFEEFAFTIDSFEHAIFEGTNKQREGLAQLKLDKTMCEVAKLRCIELQESHRLSHEGFEDDKAFLIAEGLDSATENIAYGYTTPEAFLDAWWNSEPHRMALLSKSYRYIGIGVSNDKKWACVIFGVDYDSNN